MFFLLVSVVFTANCQTKKNGSISLLQTTIKIDSCGIFYKGQRLDLGTPLSDWEKVLGKPNRKTNQGDVWDEIGISVSDWEIGENLVDAVRIHFLNLSSPEGQNGELNFARGYESLDNIIKRNKADGYTLDEDVIRKISDKQKFGDEAPKNFVYPFKLYQGNVNLHGFPVNGKMKVEEINTYRENLPFSGLFRYVDDDIDGVNDSGVINKTFGGDYRAGGTICLNGRLQYYELTFTSSGKLEYLKIGYEDKENYEWRVKNKKSKL